MLIDRRESLCFYGLNEVNLRYNEADVLWS